MEPKALRVALRIWVVLVLAFMFVPIVLIVLYSFNRSNIESWPIAGFSLHWYSVAFHDPQVRSAFLLSLRVGLFATVLALLLGSAVAYALYKFTFFGREAISFLLILPLALLSFRSVRTNLERIFAVDIMVIIGVLMNRIAPGKHHGNLRTDAEFEDFNITLEVRTQAGSNSGVYLRGIYEIQIAETYGKPVDPHNMGALYSRITPSVAAEKPIGEWQTMSITLVDRHVTVVLNDRTIIDNQPVLGCTGGAMTSDESKPGPIMLQGDHTNIDYRNIVLRPVVK